MMHKFWLVLVTNSCYLLNLELSNKHDEGKNY